MSAGTPIVIRNQTSYSDTIMSTDRGKLLTYSNAGGIAVKLPRAGGTFPRGWQVNVQNRGPGIISIVSANSTIDGAASLTLERDESILMLSDGRNYSTERRRMHVLFAPRLPNLGKDIRRDAVTGMDTSSLMAVPQDGLFTRISAGDNPPFGSYQAKAYISQNYTAAEIGAVEVRLLESHALFSDSADALTGSLIAGQFEVQNISAKTLDNAEALVAGCFTSNTGVINQCTGTLAYSMALTSNITTAIGAQFQLAAFDGHTITTGYTAKINSPSLNAGSTIGTLYGLKIDDMNGGTGSTNYAIYTGTGAVHFGGAVEAPSGFTGVLVGNASTATALSSNGANCTNQFPRGVDALGAVEGCTTVSKFDAAPTFVHTDQGNTYSNGAQDFSSAASVILKTGAGYVPTANASVGYDTTQNKYVAGGGTGGTTGSFPRVLSVQFSPGDSIVDDTAGGTETAFATSYNIPPNFFIANKVLNIKAVFETACGASPPTLRLRLRLGGPTGTVVYTQAGAIAPTGNATRGFSVEFMLQGTAAPGPSVNVETGVFVPLHTPNFHNSTSAARAIATNAPQALTLTAQWGSNAANTHAVYLRQLVIQELN